MPYSFNFTQSRKKGGHRIKIDTQIRTDLVRSQGLAQNQFSQLLLSLYSCKWTKTEVFEYHYVTVLDTSKYAFSHQRFSEFRYVYH